MAHIYVMTRGNKMFSDLWEAFVSFVPWTWKRKNLKTGQDEISFVQTGLRPLRFYEIVLPEECVDEALTALNYTPQSHNSQGRNIREKGMLYAMRKALGCKLPKDFKPVATDKVMSVNGVAVQIIGLKADERGKIKDNDGTEYEQELL